MFKSSLCDPGCPQEGDRVVFNWEYAQTKPVSKPGYRDMWKHLNGATGKVIERWGNVLVVKVDGGRIETQGYPFWTKLE